MRRLAEKDLLAWFQSKDRMPLILRGARQVGKSTLVRLFCSNNHIELCEINLEISKIQSIHKNPLNMQNVINEIELLLNKKIGTQSVLFLDEIQEDPRMLQVLRYFYEQKPEIAVIAAGSLLELILNEENMSFPVGRVNFYHLGPMTFTEFLMACGEDLLIEKLEENLPIVHEKAREYLKKYFYIGGMPKVILKYIENESLLDVRDIQSQILQTYIADFPKYKKHINVSRISKIFEVSALKIGQKVIYQSYDSNSKSREIRQVIELLIGAKLLHACNHSDSSLLPLAAGVDVGIYKTYFVDIGLLNCMHRLDFKTLENEMESNFLTKGILAEQFIAQHLAFFDGAKNTPSLTYWLRDRGSQKSELDFVIQYENHLVPIEVKAQHGTRLRSLFQFSKDKGWGFAIKFSMNLMGLHHSKLKLEDKVVEVKYLEVPLYFVENLASILKKYL